MSDIENYDDYSELADLLPSGAEAAEAASTTSGPGFARTVYATSYFDKKMGERPKILARFLTDVPEWVSMDIHSFVPTKPRPENFDGKVWPEKMNAVCRRSLVKNLKDPTGPNIPWHQDCYICDHPYIDNFSKKPATPKSRTYSLILLREAVLDPDTGVRLGFKTVTREVAVMNADGKTPDIITVPALVICQFAWANFYQAIAEFAAVYGTVCDRDIHITRKNFDKDTEYLSIPDDPIAGLDARDPEYLAKFGIIVKDGRKTYQGYARHFNIFRIIGEQSSTDYYDRWFDPSKPWISRENPNQPKVVTPVHVKAEPGVDNDKMAIMFDRLKVQPYDQPASVSGASTAAGPINFDE